LGGIELILDVRNADTVLDPDLLVDFTNCKYKAALRIAFPSNPNTPSEIDAIHKYQRERLKELWSPTTSNGYEPFNGTISSAADFRN
jgi:hypothetical protein